MSPVFDVKPFWERRNVIHICGGLRGSALSFVAQRWEAVFRRERMPVSIDRTSNPGICPEIIRKHR